MNKIYLYSLESITIVSELLSSTHHASWVILHSDILSVILKSAIVLVAHVRV